MTDPIALRNRFAMVKGAWEDHLPGVPFPRSLGDGTAEEKIERLELALVDEMRARATPETRRAGRRRDVGHRPRAPRRRPGQAARHASTTRSSHASATAGCDASGTDRPPPAGLCDSCRHQKLIRTGRGSEFSMCLRSKDDPRYASTRACPCARCPGYERRDG